MATTAGVNVASSHKSHEGAQTQSLSSSRTPEFTMMQMRAKDQMTQGENQELDLSLSDQSGREFTNSEVQQMIQRAKDLFNVIKNAMSSD